MQHEIFIYIRDFYRESRLIYGLGVLEFIRYTLFAGGFSLLFYILLRRRFFHRKIIDHFPHWDDLRREVGLSILTCFVYALVAIFSGIVIPPAWNHYYTHINEYGWPWFWTSIVLTIFLHDAYFYWTHRLMHLPVLYRAFHKAHHLSINPTPWAAYSFSPLEAAVQAGIFPVAILLYPIHPAAIAIFTLWQLTFSGLGHSGYEIFPPWFLKSWLGKFFNTPTNHTMHHQYFRGNYGLYFNIWDRMMGTNHAKYEEQFAEVTSRMPVTAKPAPQPEPEPVEVGR